MQHFTLPPPFFSSLRSTITGWKPASANFCAIAVESVLRKTLRPSLTRFSANASASASSATIASGKSCRYTAWDGSEKAPG